MNRDYTLRQQWSAAIGTTAVDIELRKYGPAVMIRIVPTVLSYVRVIGTGAATSAHAKVPAYTEYYALVLRPGMASILGSATGTYSIDVSTPLTDAELLLLEDDLRVRAF